uniref:Uncharacterized protein n=1 Tax=Panagrolaimus sp. ES5 TaxID=591445 RepID=A0AC34GD56_9BILA
MKILLKNPFEFARQQQNRDFVEPEVIRFAASQQLLNPNELNIEPPLEPLVGDDHDANNEEPGNFEFEIDENQGIDINEDDEIEEEDETDDDFYG